MEDFEEEELQEKINPLNFMQRLKRSMVMKRYHSKIEAARKRAQKRRASPEKLKDRSHKRALSLLRARLSQSKDYGEMSAAEKMSLDQRLSRVPQDVINRIAAKQLPIVRKAEAERIRQMNQSYDADERFEMFLENFTQESSVNENYYAGLSKSTSAKRKAHFEKGAAMSDENPEAYKPAPGDARAKTKTSVHTKRFHQLFKKEGIVNHDLRFKRYKPKKNIFESTESFVEELNDLIESVENIFESPEEGLRNKAEQTGISYGVLKKVYDRGVAAWRTGHRPGTTPSQWGMARVNSFATKGSGTWGKADSDLAAKVRKEEVEVDEDCWTGYKPIGLKKKGDKMVPNCVKEGQAADMARSSISMEKEADSAKHKNMMDNARKVDAKRKSLKVESSEVISKIISREQQHKKIASALKSFAELAKNADSSKHLEHASNVVKSHSISMKPEDLVRLYHRIQNAKEYEKSFSAFDAWESVQLDKNDPKNREYGTNSLVKILKSDTPGEDLDEAFGRSFGSWSDEMNKASKKVKADAEEKSKKKGPVTSDTLKDINDKLGNNKKNSSITKEEANINERFESFMEGTARGFENKLTDVPNVKVRMIDGKIKSLPSGKSSSSDGGDGE